ncbi:MAG TPA: 16S rRNA (guanine(966)-N(2))-methyltransferase RsmD [Epulopiscium sp.]|nr:16S rRNA (guanine(966)-N(2))-methyltransferase RsmD [Candidatus Epulonipiscium sp.]
MRVITGKARGTKLIGPEGLETRPTSDRIKESLFNIMGQDLYDISFLDIFSGSGAIGIEALSRGAKEATFIEISKAAYKYIERNIQKTRFHEESTILNMSVDQALNQLGSHHKKFDVIFMDPPYNKEMINNTLSLIIKNALLASDGYIVVERPSDYTIDNHKELQLWKEKKYGITTMSFLKGVENI